MAGRAYFYKPKGQAPMSNQKRNTTLQALNIGIEGRPPLTIDDDIAAIIADDSTKISIIGGIDPDGNVIGAQLTADGKLEVNATVTAELSATDIQIGAVEIKDGTTDTRVVVQSDGVDNALVVMQNSQPLPTGAATEATLSGIDTTLTDNSQKTQIVDSGGNAVAVTANALDVNIASGSITVSLSESTDDILVYGWDGAANKKIKTDAAGELQVDVLSMPVVTTTASTLASDLGVTAYDLSSADNNFGSVDLLGYRSASVQVVWSGATSSDAFVTPGIFTVEISNDNTNWESFFTESIDAASGSELNRGVLIDFRYIRISWDQNNSTGGSATISAVCK